MSAISAPLPTATTATNGPALVWATKAGQQKAAFSPVGAAQAPRAARMGEATSATLLQLQNGQYRPILRDIVAALTGAKLAGLRDHISRHLTRELDGLSVIVSDWASVKLNKGTMLAIAAWGAAPYMCKEAKTVITRDGFSLTKKQVELFAPLIQWAQAAPVVEAEAEALPVAEAEAEAEAEALPA